MESLGLANHIQVSSVVYERLRDCFEFEERGTIEVKGKGDMQTYFLMGRK
jgi:class 3 adenylate cyclase